MNRARSRRLATATKLNLVPMLDMFTFVLIFLVVSFAPQEAKYRTHSSLKLPTATTKIMKSSKLHLQLVNDQLVLNGKSIVGANIDSNAPEAWAPVKKALQSSGLEKQAIVVSADKDTAFGRVDHLVSKLSSLGYDEIYFLARQKKEDESK